MKNEKEQDWKGKNAVVIYSENDSILSARGQILDVSDKFITIKTEVNNLAISTDSIIKVKFPHDRRGEENDVPQWGWCKKVL